MQLKRTFHPVGHGAFYTEKFYDEHNETSEKHNVVFDCGCFETAKTGCSRADYVNRIIDEIDKTFCERESIDALFISHFHMDHIIGVPHLINRCDVRKIFIPILTQDVIIEATLYNYAFSGSNEPFDVILEKKEDNPGLFCEVAGIDEGSILPNIETANIEEASCGSEQSSPVIKVGNWYYIPYNIIHDSLAISQLLQDLGLDNDASDVDITNAIKNVGASRCKDLYSKIYSDKHNSYSMTVLSYSGCANKCIWNCIGDDSSKSPRYCINNCLYMGDFEAKIDYPESNENLSHLLTYYENYIKRVGMVQVPHHGSEHNYNANLYKTPKICVISASRDDKYGHPDGSVLSGLQGNNCITLLVTEEPKTLQEFSIMLNGSGDDARIQHVQSNDILL